ncbi:MAG: APC family permease, partial [Pseudobdellovibrionaceae bacterium]
MTGLNRSLGIPMLTFYGTGMILGAGVYSVIGKAAGHTGEALWLAFLLAGIAALLTAFSYAELSTMFPKAGAEFVYLSHAFKTKKWLAVSAGVAMAFSGAATAATVALSFSGYLNQFFENPSQITAAVLLLVFTAVAILGIRNS